jgi:HEAT repeat protein
VSRIGPEAAAATPALIAVLNEPFDASHYLDPAREAARALGQMGPRREAIAALVDVISPEKVERNLASFPRLGETGSPPSDVPARKALRIMSAIDALGDIGPPAGAAVPAMIAAYYKALETDHSMAMTAIPVALGRIAPNSAAAPDAVAVLIRALDAKYPAYRVGAVEALAHFGTDAAAAIPKLRALQEDSDRFTRDAAAKCLTALEAQTKPDAGRELGRRRP